MSRKIKVNLLTIVLSLIAALTTQANAATTFYEVWRNTTNDISSAELVEKWWPDPGWTDSNVIPGQIYYYWVRGITTEQIATTLLLDSRTNTETTDMYETQHTLSLTYPVKALKGYTGEKFGSPLKYELLLKSTLDIPGFRYTVLKTIYEEDPLLSYVLMSDWPTELWDPRTDAGNINLYQINETIYLDLYYQEKDRGSSADDTAAEVYAEVTWEHDSMPFRYFKLSTLHDGGSVTVPFVEQLDPPLTNFKATSTPDSIQLQWTPCNVGDVTNLHETPATGRIPITIYVDWFASGDNNGTSWQDAYHCIQDALDSALYGDRILVANGIYLPDEGQNHTRYYRTETFQLVNGVKMYGGYAGWGAPDPNERNISENESVLSGDLNRDDEPNFVNRADNSYHVVTGSNTDPNTILDGFTISDGYADVDGTIYELGAGLYNNGGNPAIINCTFINNFADYYGGAVSNNFSSSVFLNCSFRGNYCNNMGGAMHNWGSSPSIINCIFTGNTASQGGGIFNCHGGDVLLVNCSFSANKSSVDTGHSIYNYSSGPDSVAVANSVFWGVLDGTAKNHISGTTSVRYSCIQDNAPDDGTVYAGLGNIDLDPEFVHQADDGGDGWGMGDNDDYGDLRLQYASPCVETGDNSEVPPDTYDIDNNGNTLESIPYDLVGHNRLIDWNKDLMATVDMGAYERGVCSGNPDLDNSGKVNLVDFAMFAAKWLNTDCDCYGSCCDGADLDSNEEVNADDLLILVNHWLSPSPSNYQYIGEYGSLGSATGYFNKPHDIAIDSQGFIYVVEQLNHRVQKFTSNWEYVTHWNTADGTTFQYPGYLDIDSEDNVYVADDYNNRVVKIKTDGTTEVFATGFNHTNGIAISDDDYIYVASHNNYNIKKFNKNGTLELVIGSAGTGDGEFDRPQGVALDANGFLYVVDMHNSRVQKFTTNGDFVLTWGQQGTEMGEFNLPIFIDVDSSGYIWVTDFASVQKFTPNGNCVLRLDYHVFGGMVETSNGLMYYCDITNHKINMYELLP